MTYSFRTRRPANSDRWITDFADSVEGLFRQIMPAPFRLHDYATADLPTAADWTQGLVYDSDEDNVAVSNGSGWVYWSFSDHVHAAGDVTFAPAGSISADDVQAAIQELDSEKQPLDADLTALAALSTTGIVSRTGSGSFELRSITGTANEITVTNGGGVLGAPTLSLPSAITGTGKTWTGGTFSDLSSLTVVNSQDAATTLQVNNGNSGTSASAGAEYRNGALGDNDRFIMRVNGTGYTVVTGWGDAGVISTRSNISGGLILNAVAAAGIKFEVGGSGSGSQVGDMTATAFSCPSATTASAANVFQSASSAALLRSTSSNRYKQDIQDLPANQADKVLDLRPIRFRSKAAADDPTRPHWGLVAEEVHEVLPVLVNYDAEGIPDGVQYDRIIPGLLSVVKRLEARVAALESAL